jgi:hypothetical protein
MSIHGTRNRAEPSFYHEQPESQERSALTGREDIIMSGTDRID